LILVYLIPVVIVAFASAGATVFFSYPPIYGFALEDSQHLIELSTFGLVAIVIGHLATNLRRQADLTSRRESVKPKNARALHVKF
jgi:K+-sensing histidine kinase KdpD